MLSLSAAERDVCSRVAVFIRGIAASPYFSECSDGALFERYAETMEAIVRLDGSGQLQADRHADIDQAAFILEGIYIGLESADLLNAARAIQRDLYTLDDLSSRLNRLEEGADGPTA